MPSPLLDRLEKWKSRFGSPGDGQLERLLAAAAQRRFGDAASLIKLHETTLFLRAYPRNKEVARLAAEPISAAQFRHGPMEIIHPNHRYIIFARQGKTGKLLLKLARDIRKSSGRVLLFTDMPFDDLMNVRWVRVDPLRLGLGTLVDNLYIQLLAHEAALRAGLQPGKFEIAENVTREE